MFFIISFFLCSLQIAPAAIGQTDSILQTNSHISSVTNTSDLFVVLTSEEISKLRRDNRRTQSTSTTDVKDVRTAPVSTDTASNTLQAVQAADGDAPSKDTPSKSDDVVGALALAALTTKEPTPFSSCFQEAGVVVNAAAPTSQQIRDRAAFCQRKVDLGKEFRGKCTEELTLFWTGKFDSDKDLALERCEDEQEDLKNLPKKCRKVVRKKYTTAAEADKNPDDKDKKKAATTAERKLKRCEEKYGDSSTNSRCKDAADDLKDLKREFNSSCGELGGEDACIRTLRSCNECDPSGQVTTFSRSSDLDCVVIKNSAVCPEMTKDIADDLEKDRDKYEEKIEDLADKIAELKENKSQLEGELSDEKLSYEAEIEALKAEKEGVEEELENSMKALKGEVDMALKSAIAKVQGELSTSQQLQFKLSNAIYDANRKYRDSKNQVYLKCKQESAERLSNYRKARKAAIRHGNFQQESIFEILQSNRVSFAQKDDARYLRYYSTCLTKNKYILEALKEDLGVALNRITQEKKLITAQFKSMQSQLAALSGEADAKKQTALQEYATQLQKIASRSQKQNASSAKIYNQKAQLLSKQIVEKNMEIIQTQGQLREAQNKFYHSQEMYNRLRAAGSPSEDKSSQLAEASEKHANLQEEWANAFDTCDCTQGTFDSDSEEQECQRIKKAGRLVEPDHDNLKNPPKPRKNKKKTSSTDNPKSNSQ